MYAPDFASVATPIGLVVIEGDAARVTRIRIAGSGLATSGTVAAVREAAAQIDAYFANRLRRFDIPIRAAATGRGEMLRRTIVDIGFGQTASYGELASSAGSSERAVGRRARETRSRSSCHAIAFCRQAGRWGHIPLRSGPATKRWLLAFEGALLM